LDLVQKIEKEEGKQIAYFDADLVNSISVLQEINMVTTLSFVSDNETEEFKDEQGEDTYCDDPEYGDTDLQYMMYQKQPSPKVIKLQ
jgi:hypothetical protein